MFLLNESFYVRHESTHRKLKTTPTLSLQRNSRHVLDTCWTSSVPSGKHNKTYTTLFSAKQFKKSTCTSFPFSRRSSFSLISLRFPGSLVRFNFVCIITDMFVQFPSLVDHYCLLRISPPNRKLHPRNLHGRTTSPTMTKRITSIRPFVLYIFQISVQFDQLGLIRSTSIVLPLPYASHLTDH